MRMMRPKRGSQTTQLWGWGREVWKAGGESNSAGSGVDRHLSVSAPGSKGMGVLTAHQASARAADSITACPGGERWGWGGSLRPWWQEVGPSH